MRKSIPAILAVMAMPVAALAHHGWGSYDASKVLTIKAPVVALSWQNPHVTITLKHDGHDWQATLAPISRMQRRGLTEAMLAPGQEISVEGYSSTKVEHEMRAERLVAAGRTFELR